LANILNNKEGGRDKIYGDCCIGPRERKQLGNLVQRWKGFSKEDCLEKVYIPHIIKRADDGGASNNDINNPKDELDNKPAPLKPPRRSTPQMHKPAPSITQKIHSEEKVSTMNNLLGKKIVVPLTKGRIFVAVWVNSKLANEEIIISKDGCSVYQRSKEPHPVDASELLAHCTWGGDPENVIVSTVDKELQQLLPNGGDPDKWITKEIVTLEEEVVRSFVDTTGKTSNHIGHNVDKDGKRYITFFLKTMKSHRKAPSKGIYTNNNSGNGPTGMDVGDGLSMSGDDGCSLLEETVDPVEDVHAEMDQKLSNISNALQGMLEEMRKAQAQQEQQQQ